jgi:serine O-acetyltransferase
MYSLLYSLHVMGIPYLPGILNKLLIRIPCACQIGMGAKFGKNIRLGYGGLGIVIHDRCVLGDNVEIGSNVTIGGTSGKYRVPVIGNNVIISTGAKVLGEITIGDNCVIGANSVVIKDVPPNSLVAGVPAKILKSQIDVNEYK